MSTPTVEILGDVPTLIQRSLALIVEKLQAAIATHGKATIALSGGSTPKPLYEAIAQQNLPWDKIHVFWGDERYVPADHPDSNLNMTQKAWLSKVSILAANVHPMPTSESDPAIAAQKYEQHLRQVLNSPNAVPALDVILLGMGDDGHTASLFPRTEALKVRDRLVAVGNKDGQVRLTFTVPLINQAKDVIFLVAGSSKQNALSQIFSPTADPIDYPAKFIQPQGTLWWLLDEAAGEVLAC